MLDIQHLPKQDQDEIVEAWRSAEAAAVARIPEMVAEYDLAHHEDFTSYAFSCERWGDFLSVKIERGGERVAAALNLGATGAIRLHLGHVPDRKGVAHYFLSYRLPGGGSRASSWMRPRDADERYYVSLSLSLEDAFPPVAIEEGAPDHRQESRNTLAGLTTKNFPRRAQDDVITVGATRLRVPAGRGQAVYDELLRASGAYFDAIGSRA